MWAKMDSNHRRRKPADLQSAPFGHSGICPYIIKRTLFLTKSSQSKLYPNDFRFISPPPREERLIPLILERASCRIRTNDPEITNHVLWPTELKRQAKKCNRNVHSVSETAANLGIYFYPQILAENYLLRCFPCT